METVSDNNLKFVYENIAISFDKTRYRSWTTVERILDTFEEYTINGDIGCGNGKNMLYRDDLKFIGVDFCSTFVKICKNKNLECYESDIRNTKFIDQYFDNTISIAVIHHLDTCQKRIQAINELFRITKKHGNIFIYVWAFNQPKDSRRQFKNHDEMVPFKTKNNTFYRYYHLYKKDELESEIEKSSYDYKIIESGYELGNYYIYLKKL